MGVDLGGELHPETLRILETVPPGERSRRGQFFTPRQLREEVLRRIPRLVRPRVLDPACGTGEFLLSAREYFVEPELYCWEVDPRLAEVAKRVVPEARVEVVDSLTKPFREEFDVVVTNPPYYEFRPDGWVRERFKEVIWGRVNIYALFVYLSLRLLKPGGWLGLVVSSSMNNGAYFRRLREYVVRVADIAYMRVLDDPRVFDGVNHTFQVLVLRKAPNTGRYVFRRGGILIFSEKAEELRRIFEGSATLGELGYRVQTGRVVWNQHRDKLTDDPGQGVLLVWSHNIRGGRLVLGNGRRPQYIRWGGRVDRGPAIVVKRVTGHPKRLRLEAALVPPGTVFVAENHVNVVYPPRRARLEELERLVEYLNSGFASRLVSAITGNTQVSKNELENLVPVPLRLVSRD
ncbi:HsdM family class I SAM-dependent methyltransferase [Thermogladius sp.]|uniref:HsdM family class I SAM-dependent methyltransferase n=1 Tax=Thermogladius sp. TaxID=2023064 RepID=UPI003D0F2149